MTFYNKSALTFLLSGFLIAWNYPVGAQGLGLESYRMVQAGVGFVPGVGIQCGYISPRAFYTVEGITFVDVTPSYLGGEGTVQVAVGLGGAIRPMRLAQLIGNKDDPGYNVDVGLRFGPGLMFSFAETKITKNQRFNLFLEPYVRITSPFAGRRIYFAEVGIQRPIFRAGMWFHL